MNATQRNLYAARRLLEAEGWWAKAGVPGGPHCALYALGEATRRFRPGASYFGPGGEPEGAAFIAAIGVENIAKWNDEQADVGVVLAAFDRAIAIAGDGRMGDEGRSEVD